MLIFISNDNYIKIFTLIKIYCIFDNKIVYFYIVFIYFVVFYKTNDLSLQVNMFTYFLL